MNKLRRELGLRDVTLFAIACMVSTRWIPAAAHAGPGSVTLWLLAAVLFAVPLAIAVATLSVKYPGAGGLYLWTRDDFGPWHGFLCFWVYWLGMAFWFPSAAMFYMSAGLDAAGPACAHLGENRVVPDGRLAGGHLGGARHQPGRHESRQVDRECRAAPRPGSWPPAGRGGGYRLETSRPGHAASHFRPRWNWGTVNFWSSIAYGMSGLETGGNDRERNPRPRTDPAARRLDRFGFRHAVLHARPRWPCWCCCGPGKISEMNGLAQVAGRGRSGHRRSGWRR